MFLLGLLALNVIWPVSGPVNDCCKIEMASSITIEGNHDTIRFFTHAVKVDFSTRMTWNIPLAPERWKNYMAEKKEFDCFFGETVCC